MRITPVMPAYHTKNPPRQQRATMSIRFEEHTVTDSVTGNTYQLPEKAAWELHDKLNGIIV